MPIPSSITDLSATASSNSPSGGDSPNVIDDHIRAQAAIIRQVYDASAAKSETLTNKTISLANNSVSGTAAQFNSAVSDADFVTVGGALGTPSSGTLTNCTFPTLNQNTSGTAADLSSTLSVAKGGTGLTSAGTSGNVLTSNGSAWESSPPSSGLGYGQTWQDMTASRASATTYTNSTGKPIEVSIKLGGVAEIAATVGGVSLSSFYVSGSFIVPNGFTYSATLGAGLSKWTELR